MSRRLAPQEHALYPGEVRNVAIDFSGLLDDGETLSSVTQAEESTSTLVVSSEQINAAEVVINGASVPIGHAVQLRVDHNNAAAEQYVVDIECLTSASQEVVGSVILRAC